MFSGRIPAFCIAASLSMAPGGATADSIKAGGGLFGPILGGGIIIELGKKKKPAPEPEPQAAPAQPQKKVATAPKPARPAISAVQREENRQVQVALNYFDLPVGAPDGIIGRQTRAAISDFQKLIGAKATGALSEDERKLLLEFHARALGDEAAVNLLASASEDGKRAVLAAWHAETLAPPAETLALADPSAAPAGEAPAAAAEPEPVVAAAPVPEPAEEPDVAAAPAEPELPALPTLPVLAEAAQDAIPNLFGGGAAKVSLAAHCEQVSLRTATAGGFVDAVAMSDPVQALNEQFCLARTFAITDGADLARRIPGLTPRQIAEQCAGFGPAMRAEVASVSAEPVEAVQAAVRDFALARGIPEEQLLGTARICLSVAYRTDDLDAALASALTLTALGQRVYAELIGHHLAQGIGVEKRPDLALGWYQHGLDALASGEMAVFAPGQFGRHDVVRRAAYAIVGRPDPEAAPAALAETAQPVPPATEAGPERTVIAATPGFTILSVEPEDPALVAAADAAASGIPAAPGDKVSALPMAARLVFLLFRH